MLVAGPIDTSRFQTVVPQRCREACMSTAEFEGRKAAALPVHALRWDANVDEAIAIRRSCRRLGKRGRLRCRSMPRKILELLGSLPHMAVAAAWLEVESSWRELWGYAGGRRAVRPGARKRTGVVICTRSTQRWLGSIAGGHKALLRRLQCAAHRRP